jgi:hypothetical protein
VFAVSDTIHDISEDLRAGDEDALSGGDRGGLKEATLHKAYVFILADTCMQRVIVRKRGRRERASET